MSWFWHFFLYYSIKPSDYLYHYFFQMKITAKDARQLAINLSKVIDQKYDWAVIVGKWAMIIWYYLCKILWIKDISFLSLEFNDWVPTIYSGPMLLNKKRYLVIDDYILSWMTMVFVENIYKGWNVDYAIWIASQWHSFQPKWKLYLWQTTEAPVYSEYDDF